MKKLSIILSFFICASSLMAQEKSILEQRREEILNIFLNRDVSMKGRDAGRALPVILAESMAALYLNKDVKKVNSLITEYKNDFYQLAITEEKGDRGAFHWRANQLNHVYEMLSKLSPSASGLAIIREAWYRSLEYEDKKGYLFFMKGTEQSKDHHNFWGSENHHFMQMYLFWSSLKVLSKTSYKSRKFRGRTISDLWKDADTYMKEFLEFRYHKGMLLECGSPSYQVHSLSILYGLYQYGDEELSASAKKFLDAWWIQWAHEQIDYVRGGSKQRAYKDKIRDIKEDLSLALTWFHFNKGFRSVHHSPIGCAMANYEIPQMAKDILNDKYDFSEGWEMYGNKLNGRYKSGIKNFQYNDENMYPILRYSYRTNSFIVGTEMHELASWEDLMGITCQNEFSGIVYREKKGQLTNLRAFPNCIAIDDHANLNERVNLQYKGTLMSQPLEEGLSRGAGKMIVYISPGLKVHEELEGVPKGVLIIEAPEAYTVVYFTNGKYGNKGEEYFAKGPGVVVIMDTVDKNKYASLKELIAAVGKDRVQMKGTVVEYTSLYEDVLSFDSKGERVRKINGAPVNFENQWTFKSPIFEIPWNKSL